MHLMKPIVAVAIIFMLAGCVIPYPHPHNNWKSPIFEGQVVYAESGQPVVNAMVYLEGYEEKGVLTDREGFFELGAVKDFEWFSSFCIACDSLAEAFIITVSHSELGTAQKETMPCIGHAYFLCNGRRQIVNFEL